MIMRLSSVYVLLLILVCATATYGQVREPEYYQGAQYDSVYWDPGYRDSVSNYTYRLHAYRFEILSYDLGLTFSMLPVLGQWYVDNTAKGITYSALRAGALTVSGIGVAGLFSQGNTLRDIGFAVGGLVLYGILKYLDIMDVQHAISQNNEYIVEKFNIAVEDVQPTSIRYPEKDGWPEWVTSSGPKREPHHPHREVIDKPIPSVEQFQIGVQVPF